MVVKRSSGQIEVTGREARGGFRDRPVLVVLLVSLVLIAILFALMLGGYFA